MDLVGTVGLKGSTVKNDSAILVVMIPDDNNLQSNIYKLCRAYWAQYEVLRFHPSPVAAD
jgi:hypothetical protein